MKKLAYIVPQMKSLYMEQLMAAAASGKITGTGDGIDISGDGGYDDGTHDPDAKEGFVTVSSVWDD